MARSILFSHYTALEICSGLADRAMHDVTKACSFREVLDMGAVRGQVGGVGLARIRHAPADSIACRVSASLLLRFRPLCRHVA